MFRASNDMSTGPGKCIFLSVADVQPVTISLVTSAIICVDSGRLFLPTKSLDLIGEIDKDISQKKCSLQGYIILLPFRANIQQS